MIFHLHPTATILHKTSTNTVHSQKCLLLKKSISFSVRNYKFLILIAFAFCSCLHHNHTEKKAAVKEDTVNVSGKKGMILLTDRPPNLETPLRYFKEDYTPDDVFFVRW